MVVIFLQFTYFFSKRVGFEYTSKYEIIDFLITGIVLLAYIFRTPCPIPSIEAHRLDTPKHN